jgi:DNA modification methylase
VPTLGTNSGAPVLGFQSWHRFKEAFPPELVERAIRESPIQVERCLDVFGGSGTTALTAQFLGVSSTTVEVNPFLVDVIRAKLDRYDTESLSKSLLEVRRRSRAVDGDPAEVFRDVPATFVEPGVDGRWLFGNATAQRLAAILAAIDELELETHRRLLRVLVGGLLVEVSNAVVSGKGRRYRRNWEVRERERVPSAVDDLFFDRLRRALRDIYRFTPRPAVSTAVLHGDARRVRLRHCHELAIFSPPYPNSFDYTDVYNIELWMLGYLESREDNRRLRDSTLASHVQLFRDYPAAPGGSSSLDRVATRLDAVRETLWSPWIPAMIGGYFADLLAVLQRVRRRLSPGGNCWIVVGDSRYGGVHVPTARILSELVQAHGWSVSSMEPCRAMRSSAQQGGMNVLAETLVVLAPG